MELKMIDNCIYQFWFGSKNLPTNRAIGLITSLYNLNCKIRLITDDNLKDFIIPNYPLHPGFTYLSQIHKSDYLRSYFMHFYGGGYADIKKYSSDNNWKECFEIINSDNDIFLIGQQEILGGSAIKEFNTAEILNKVVANGYFICRSNTEFTKEWYNRVQKQMDLRYNELKNNPAIDPFGQNKNYPIRWAELQCEIFHKLIIDMYDQNKIKNCLITGRTNEPYR